MIAAKSYSGEGIPGVQGIYGTTKTVQRRHRCMCGAPHREPLRVLRHIGSHHDSFRRPSGTRPTTGGDPRGAHVRIVVPRRLLGVSPSPEHGLRCRIRGLWRQWVWLPNSSIHCLICLTHALLRPCATAWRTCAFGPIGRSTCFLYARCVFGRLSSRYK